MHCVGEGEKIIGDYAQTLPTRGTSQDLHVWPIKPHALAFFFERKIAARALACTLVMLLYMPVAVLSQRAGTHAP